MSRFRLWLLWKGWQGCARCVVRTGKLQAGVRRASEGKLLVGRGRSHGGMGMLEGRQERSSSRGAGASGPLQLLECTRLEGGDCHASLGEKSQGLRG